MEHLLTAPSVIALSKLYSLNDARLSQVQVKGDLVPAEDDGLIKTRSRARMSMDPYDPPGPPLTDVDPDKYTIIPASLKIIKVLIEELLSASGARAAAAAAAHAMANTDDLDDDDGDEGWEDDNDIIDLTLGSTKSDLMSFIEAGGHRQRDDETQAFLTEFFVSAARDNVANFQEWYNLLTEDEKTKLNQMASPDGQ